MERGVGGGRENPWEILGNSGWGGEVWARTGSGWRLLLQLGRASSVPAGNASTALQWQLAYGGWIGYDWGLSHYLDWGLAAAVSPAARRRSATVVRFSQRGMPVRCDAVMARQGWQ